MCPSDRTPRPENHQTTLVTGERNAALLDSWTLAGSVRTVIVNVHRRQTPNCGDQVSGPLPYLESKQKKVFVDIMRCDGSVETVNEQLSRAKLIIVGGGGLLDMPKFGPAISFLAQQYGKKTVIWGAGSNAHPEPVDGVTLISDTSPFALVGRRDYAFWKRKHWVPCASCLHPSLRKLIAERKSLYKGGTAILENNSGQLIIEVGSCGQDVRRMGNKSVSFEELISFILSADLLVTSSFHGVYWATLCQVPVIGIPTTNKFFTLKHKVPLADPEHWLHKVKDARIYPKALAECTAANLTFLRQVNERWPALELSWPGAMPSKPSPVERAIEAVRKALAD